MQSYQFFRRGEGLAWVGLEFVLNLPSFNLPPFFIMPGFGSFRSALLRHQARRCLIGALTWGAEGVGLVVGFRPVLPSSSRHSVLKKRKMDDFGSHDGQKLWSVLLQQKKTKQQRLFVCLLLLPSCVSFVNFLPACKRGGEAAPTILLPPSTSI